MDLPPPLPLSDRVRAFLQRLLYPVLATSGDDGTPHQAVIWYRLEADERILVNSRSPRRWPRELAARGGGSLAFTDLENPMSWVGVQTVVEEVIDDVEQARDDICALAERYDDATESSIRNFRSQERISFRLRVVAVHDHIEE